MMTKDELITKLANALINALEGEKEHDIVSMTGISEDRAKELRQLVIACEESWNWRTNTADIAKLLELVEVQ